MHRHIYDINLAWGQFLDYYTDLNNARKEKDDSYAEQNHIGEEVIEPDEPGMEKGTYDSANPSEEIKQHVADQLEKEEQTENMLSDLQQEIQKEESKQVVEPVDTQPAQVEIGKKMKVKKSKVIMQDWARQANKIKFTSNKK